MAKISKSRKKEEFLIYRISSSSLWWRISGGLSVGVVVTVVVVTVIVVVNVFAFFFLVAVFFCVFVLFCLFFSSFLSALLSLLFWMLSAAVGDSFGSVGGIVISSNFVVSVDIDVSFVVVSLTYKMICPSLGS